MNILGGFYIMASNYDLAYNLIIDLKNKLNEETILEKKFMY